MTLLARLARSVAVADARTSNRRVEGPGAVPEGGQGYAHIRTRWPYAPRGRAGVLGGALAEVTLPCVQDVARGLDRVCISSSGAGQARAVFVDLETTGLGGVGAVPFVIGIGHLLDEGAEGWCVEQWCLERLGAEEALLRAFSARLGELRATHLLSFNGASFDLPFMRRRLGLHGLGELRDCLDPARVMHVDLLHVSRRLWRDRVPNCRLATIESHLLNIHRVGDLPGSEVPEVFWEWLRTPQDPRCQARLRGVRVHNQVDLLALPVLLSRVEAALTRPRDLQEALQSARHLDSLGAVDAALAVLCPWLGVDEVPRGGELWRCASLLAARWLRRRRRHDEALRLWERLHSLFPGDPEVHEALAKDLEHRQRDPRRALQVARSSMQPCPRRLARLEKKVGFLDTPSCVAL